MNEILEELATQLVLEDDGLGGIRSYAKVGPPMARKLLSLSRGNRPLSNNTVNKYKHHMENGTWDEDAPTQFITFNCDEVLINGHHTLTAVIKSGRTIKLYFMFNVQNSAYYDGGRTRSEADRFCMMEGTRTNFYSYKRAIAICNVLDFLKLEDLPTEDARHQYITAHLRDFEWMAENLKKRGRFLSTAPIYAAVLLAKMNGAPGARLSYFWDVLQTGFSETANDRSIIRFRDWVIAQGDSRTSKYRRTVLCTCSDVLSKWLDNKTVRTISPQQELSVWSRPVTAANQATLAMFS